jgi:GTPase SAR1 family protein
MTEASPENALRIVFLGLPGAGKSSLLGALVQAAQLQGAQLGARVIDDTQGLGQLHKGVYERGPAPTHDEVVTYPVTVEPLPDHPAMPAGEALLVDSSGQTAVQLLSQDGAAAAGALPKAVSHADALVVVIDASSDAAQLGRAFTQFSDFLRGLEQIRSTASEVTDLPVYLVLTKCDLLAKQTDSPVVWMQRIEERKRAVHERFQQFIEGEATPAAQMWAEDAFGSLDVHVWATAVGRPALADRPAKPTEPFGVAELFRQCLESAADFRQRRRRASLRLRVAVIGAGTLVALLLLLAVIFFATRPDPVVVALENEIRFVLPGPAAKPAERLKEPLTEKVKKLQQIHENPKFGRLPANVRERALEYLAELEAYQAYDKQFLERVQPELADANRDKDLDDIEKSLRALPLPATYAEAWKDTKVAKRIERWWHDLDKLRETVAWTEKWFAEQLKQAEVLRNEGLALAKKASPKEKEDWLDRVRELEEHPYEPTDRVAGTSGLTYATVYNFDQIIKARNDLTEFRQKRLEPLQKVVGD